MFSRYVSPDTVLADLDKVVRGVSQAVALARDDLAEYRRWRPDIVADATERGLANWIHDRLWVHLVAELDGVPGVQIRDDEPHREIFVGLGYRLRVKRHHVDGNVSTYPTEGALAFFVQEPTLDGLEEIRLAVGYEWDRDSRSIGDPLISLRDGLDNVVWVVPLPDATAGSGQLHDLTPPALSGPAAPTVDLPSDNEQETESE